MNPMFERSFLLPEGRGKVVFSSNVLQHMYGYAQTFFWSREAGGQLFSATPEQAAVTISLATGPYGQDRRSRWGFNPDIHKATEDRIQLYAKGLYPVGLWHTHPEPQPRPSNSDRVTTEDYLAAFQGDMEGFLLAILGNKGNPRNLTVWLAGITHTMCWTQLPEITNGI